MLELNTAEIHMLDELDVQTWHSVYWAELQRRIGPLFARSDARQRALAYLASLLSPAERKNSWQLAEINGDVNPYGFQHLLGRADWNPDALRDCLRSYISDYLATPDAVGVLDETGFVKKGVHSVGVSRQYSGTAGRIENCQIGVFLTYASPLGHTLLDRELYLPTVWTDDRERCRRVGVPDKREFATKPALAQQMLERTYAAGVTFAAITGDSVYGDNRPLRHWLEEQKHSYVLAVSGKETVWCANLQQLVKAILADVPSEGWQRLSAGTGSKGLRVYDWLRLDLDQPAQIGWKRWLLVRRSITTPSEMTAYIAFAAAHSSLVEQVGIAGTRWTVEESIQTAKGEVGLDHYEVRSWTGWYRHITLAMVAQAFLAVIRAETGYEQAGKKRSVKRASLSSLAAFKAHRGLQSV